MSLWPPLPPAAIGNLEKADGVTFEELRSYVDLDPHEKEIVQGMPWIADGIDADEQSAAERLIALLYEARRTETGANLSKKAWLHDGLSSVELGVLFSLLWLFEAPWEEEIAASLSTMPFLDTVTLEDSLAFTSIVDLMSNGQDDRQFQEMWNHPAVKDGIDDHEAEVLAKLLVVGWDEHDPASPDTLRLRDPQQFEVEQRIVDLPLAGKVTIEIHRLRGTAWPGTMDAIERDLRLLEEFMSSPLPQRRVVYVISEKIQNLGTFNAWDHIMVSRNEEQTVTQTTHFTHEAAHYYWDSGETWIKEGAATFFEFMWHRLVRDDLPRIFPLDGPNSPCAEVLNLAELEKNTGLGITYECAYSMGSMLFLELHRSLDERTFRTGFRNLYLLSRHDVVTDECRGLSLKVCHVRAAFAEHMPEGTPEEALEHAREVIDGWYEGEYPVVARRLPN